MRLLISAAAVAVLSVSALADVTDARVVQVTLPNEDVTLSYVERSPQFTVELKAKDGAVEAPRVYIGDGAVAVELFAHPTNGIFLQDVKLKQGDQFKKGDTIKVRPGYKKAADLVAGDVYVKLPGVTFELPAK
ncbi:hypothetical protein GobsT_16710 [Gemmata obscuriglobus]|uniref:Uncharacterized protein n=1 Tax=Gemmata obscuriglobus TaxID=114 RepID=A0A2Z3H1M9_9BACT|nr:hypothetical protein [Gemmata obscuriglobus]AWM39933.1 hypothetical protein C1280_24970 [Gemmata obscuriglobus]QEG26923.1 hypothetical protein GobsT_16710 [Gemmata obscuriglobus]VTS03059.1 unnamed protein product [Gemmata obscuriglobus UQM 2246]